MIPNQKTINYDNLRPMLIQVYAGHTEFGLMNIESLDENLFFMYESDTDFPIMEQVLNDTWVHVDPLLPDPELDKALLGLVKLFSKISMDDSYWENDQKHGGSKVADTEQE